MAIFGRDIHEHDDVIEPLRLKEVSFQFAAAAHRGFSGRPRGRDRCGRIHGGWPPPA
jgi:hypothetical protein